jgi:hypothetical protein
MSLANVRMRLAGLIAPELAANPATSAPASRAIVLPPPTPPRDPVAARAALDLAHAYLQEVPVDTIVGNPDASAGHRSTLALAAKQLEIAAAADPAATLVIEGEGGLETVTQQRLRAHVRSVVVSRREGGAFGGMRDRRLPATAQDVVLKTWLGLADVVQQA